MRLLLDTCILAFYVSDKLHQDAKEMIHDYENQLYTSSVAVMEFINLLQFDRIGFAKNVHFNTLDVFDFIEKTLGIKIKYIDRGHLNTLLKLPNTPTHQDPNDRLMIAQAITEGLTLMSSDTKFNYYVDFGLDFIKAKHE